MPTVVDTAISGGGGGGIPAGTGDVTFSGSGSVVTTLANIPNDTTMPGDLLTGVISAPATPSAGHGRASHDPAGSGVWAFLNSGGIRSNTIIGLSSPTTSKWVQWVDTAGIQTLVQPAYPDISGSIPNDTGCAGDLLFTAIATPGAPGAGFARLWYDSTLTNFFSRDGGGVVNHGVRTISVVAHNFMTGIADNGQPSAAQAAFTDLSGSLAAGQMPALSGAVTSSAGSTTTAVGTIPGRYVATQVLTSGTTYTPTNGTVKQQIVQGWAGGGGGGGANTAATSDSFGGGGASGGYFRRNYAITTTGTYAIGGAGTAGVAAAGTGGTGGNTTFTDGTTLCTAFGGLGGVGMSGAATALVALGGASGAVSTNATVNGKGSPGGFGIRVSGVAGGGVSGHGASYMFGGGANGTNVAGAGAGAGGFASGGAGGCTLAGSAAAGGGAGPQGIIIVDEFT